MDNKKKLFFLITMLVYGIDIRCIGEEIEVMHATLVAFGATLGFAVTAYVPLVGIYAIKNFLEHSKGKPFMEALKPARIIGAGGISLGCLYVIKGEVNNWYKKSWSHIIKDPATLGAVTGISLASYVLWKLNASLENKYGSCSSQV